jgi:hypothetical protein
MASIRLALETPTVALAQATEVLAALFQEAGLAETRLKVVNAWALAVPAAYTGRIH